MHFYQNKALMYYIFFILHNIVKEFRIIVTLKTNVMRSSLKQILVFYAFIFISESSFSQCFQSNYDSAYSTHVRGEYEKSVWWAKQALICAEKELSSNNDTNYINIFNKFIN